MAGTFRERKSGWDCLTVLSVEWAAQQGIVVFRAVPDAAIGGVLTGQPSANAAFTLDQQTAGGLPGKSQHGLVFIAKVLIIAPIDGIRVVFPGIALDIESFCQVV
jgi:hypothetical protein